MLKALNYKFINTFRNLALASNPDFKRIGEVFFYKDLLKILDDKQNKNSNYYDFFELKLLN